MIQTVTGEISKNEISGSTLIHEHICCVSNDMLHAFGKRWLDKDVLIEHCSKILCDMKKSYGLELLVDGTPLDLGRDAKVLKEVSERSGVKIVASSGLYIYPSMVTLSNTEEDIAGWFFNEVSNGMENTSIKPGILKCATDNSGISEDNERRLGALGRVQAKSGLPLYIHTLHQEGTVQKALEILFDRGANLQKIIIGHLDDSCDYEYIKKLLSYGCYVSFDRRHYTVHYTETVAKTLVKLCEKGYSDRLLVSDDCCLYSDFCREGSKWTRAEDIKDTLAYVFEALKKSFIEHGGRESSYNRITSQNTLSIMDV
ncbi:MAG: hypothetical protein E7587_09490 [Ruminococcaceae bacterium]|nr:hypothetical protein [Oscillospiraceae bacterium]